jgi:hypothetical protein
MYNIIDVGVKIPSLLYDFRREKNGYYEVYSTFSACWIYVNEKNSFYKRI